jgi:P-type E1-E2 ATPase
MEALGKVDVVAFDKTGTLTVGRPRVADIVSLNTLTPDQVLGYAACAEMFSEHPLGRAIVAEAAARRLSVAEPQNPQVLTGFGVCARDGGQEVIVGNRGLLQSAGVALGPELDVRITELEARGHTVIPVAVDRQMAGLIALADELRPQAAQVVRAVKSAGVKTVMISGDNAAAVRAVAGQLGVDEYHAQVLPDQKLDIIKTMQGQGLRVAYVGDGVNDAPALAVADAGIAMGVAGADVAIETAEIALMNDDMQNVPHLLVLSRETLRTVRFNVAFSISMNILSVLLSTFGIIGPAFGAMMHELSALPVLAYSARLVAYRGSR